jgi:hypothetical protein
MLLTTTAIAGPLPEWAKALSQKGFQIQEGAMGIFDVDTCTHSDTCYAINPLTPYGLFYVPPHPNATATVIKNYSNACYGHHLCKKTAAGAPLFPMGRLAEGEIIVAVGTTPPKSIYWSFSNYLYTRYHDKGWQSNATTLAKKIGKCPDGPSRCEVFAGVNDPLNHLTAKTNTGSPFNASISILLAADAKSEGMVARAIAADSSAGPVNALRFPGQILHLGVSRGDEDELLNVMRVEGIEDEEARKVFYEHIPLRVFRVTPPPSFVIAAKDKFPSFDGRMRNRISGILESAPNCSNSDLKTGLQTLTSRIESAYGSGPGEYLRSTRADSNLYKY